MLFLIGLWEALKEDEVSLSSGLAATDTTPTGLNRFGLHPSSLQFDALERDIEVCVSSVTLDFLQRQIN